MIKVVNGYQTKEFDGNLFVRVFYHSIKANKGEDAWFNTKDIIFSNKKHKFSVIPSLIYDFRINEKYEFIIEYPNEEHYVHWRQATNPIENVSSVSYEPLNDYFPTFQGLARSSHTDCTFIDGTPGFTRNYWHYSIGAMTAHEGLIPSPLKIDGTKVIACLTDEVTLWMKVENVEKILLLPTIAKKTCNKKSFRPGLCFLIIHLLYLK